MFNVYSSRNKRSADSGALSNDSKYSGMVLGGVNVMRRDLSWIVLQDPISTMLDDA